MATEPATAVASLAVALLKAPKKDMIPDVLLGRTEGRLDLDRKER